MEPAGAVDIERTWSRIEAWMATNASEALDVLRPGVSGTTLGAVEKSLTVELPESLRQHDGQEWRWPSLIRHSDATEKMVVTGRQNEQWGVAEIADGEDAWWRRGWFPFVSRDGDCLSVALGSSGEGEVWCFLHDMDPMHSVVAPDFGTWLERWADELEADVFELDRAAGPGSFRATARRLGCGQLTDGAREGRDRLAGDPSTRQQPAGPQPGRMGPPDTARS